MWNITRLPVAGRHDTAHLRTTRVRCTTTASANVGPEEDRAVQPDQVRAPGARARTGRRRRCRRARGRTAPASQSPGAASCVMVPPASALDPRTSRSQPPLVAKHSPQPTEGVLRCPRSWTSTTGSSACPASSSRRRTSADLDIQATEGVSFDQVWADPTSGKVFCLVTGPDADAVKRVHEQGRAPDRPGVRGAHRALTEPGRAGRSAVPSRTVGRPVRHSP